MNKQDVIKSQIDSHKGNVSFKEQLISKAKKEIENQTDLIVRLKEQISHELMIIEALEKGKG